MKKLSMLLLLGIFIASCSNRPVNHIMVDYKKNHDMIGATIPGWIIEKMLARAIADSEDPEFAELANMVEDVKKVRILVGKKSAQKVKPINWQNSLAENEYEPLLMVKTTDAKVDFWVKNEGDKIQDLFLWLDAEGQIILIQCKATINLEKLPKIKFKDSKTDIKKLKHKIIKPKVISA